MTAFSFFLLAILLSYIVVRIGAIALRLTGLDWDTAKFQALSAFSRTGFTTHEAEKVVENPLRRRIVIWLIVIGNAGIISIMITMIRTFHIQVKEDLIQKAIYFLIIIAIFAIIYRLLTHRAFSTKIDNYIENYLRRHVTFKKLKWEQIFSQKEGFGIARVNIQKDNPYCGKTLEDSGFKHHKILVVAIDRGDDFIPTPQGNEIIQPDDLLLCYGNLENIKSELAGGGPDADKNNSLEAGDNIEEQEKNRIEKTLPLNNNNKDQNNENKKSKNEGTKI